MADARAAQGERKEPPDEEAALSARLQRLGERLAAGEPAIRKRLRSSSDRRSFGDGPRFPAFDRTGRGRAGRRVIGWLLDRWLGISPWGLIVFLLLGFAAGVLNVMRAAGVVRESNLND